MKTPNKVLILAIAISGLTNKEISSNFGVSCSTVQRWREGTNEPHPIMVPLVLEFLNKSMGR